MLTSLLGKLFCHFWCDVVIRNSSQGFLKYTLIYCILQTAEDTHCCTTLLTSSNLNKGFQFNSSLCMTCCHLFSVSVSSSSVIWQSSAFSPCFLPLRMASWQPLPPRLFLMRLQWIVDGSTKGPYASLRSRVSSLLDSPPPLFFKDVTFRYCSSAIDSFISFHVFLSTFLTAQNAKI